MRWKWGEKKNKVEIGWKENWGKKKGEKKNALKRGEKKNEAKIGWKEKWSKNMAKISFSS